MTHKVKGLIAKPNVLNHFAQVHSTCSPISLPQGFAILPLTDEAIESIVGNFTTGHISGFEYYSEQLDILLRDASVVGAVMYFETEYFGGNGMQGAAVFESGNLVYDPKAADIGPINEALAMLGVKVMADSVDEFVALDLHTRRGTNAWLTASI